MNNSEKTFYEQDFSQLKPLFESVRAALSNGTPVKIKNKTVVNKLIDYNEKGHIYITLYQDFVPYMTFGSSKPDLESALDECIYNLRREPRFGEFDINHPEKIRVLIEWITDKQKIDISKIHLLTTFDKTRLEFGINGLAIHKTNWYNWLPSASIAKNASTLVPIIYWAFQKLNIKLRGEIKLSEAKEVLKNINGAEYYLTKTHCVLSVNDIIVPLYRGECPSTYAKYSRTKLKTAIQSGADWLLKYYNESSGKFLYFYNHIKDNHVDYEHPTRKEPDLYYNDLRHSGCVIFLLYAYELTGNNKYLDCARKAITWLIDNTVKTYKDEQKQENFWTYYNKKGKLGGSGILLCALMKYRIITKDESYDKYIEGLVRHLISRVMPNGEFIGYYIHPKFNNGKPITNPSIEDKKALYSQYYPGEALLGIALFINHYPKKMKLIKSAYDISKLAMHWIINERPKYYPEFFDVLPADSWLMQAIEEFSKCKDQFLEKEAIDFVFYDADIMVKQMYKDGDTPYLDLEGALYYSYGEYYYFDGARSEGLISAYYLAKNLGYEERAEKYLNACKLSAKAQYRLLNTEINTYANLNPAKSIGSIKFIANGKEFVRIDAFQHTGCFYARLYMAGI